MQSNIFLTTEPNTRFQLAVLKNRQERELLEEFYNLVNRFKDMDADIQGCYKALNKSYKAFEHNGKPMSKIQVKKCLEYGILHGMNAVSEIPEDVVSKIVEIY